MSQLADEVIAAGTAARVIELEAELKELRGEETPTGNAVSGKVDIVEIEAALDAATPGTWAWNFNGNAEMFRVGHGPSHSKADTVLRYQYDFTHGFMGSPVVTKRTDSHLIANAPTWLRRLIDEVARLRKDPEVAIALDYSEQSARQLDRIADLEEQLTVSRSICDDREKLLDLFDCPAHGPGCIPNAIDEVEHLRAANATLEQVVLEGGAGHEAIVKRCGELKTRAEKAEAEIERLKNVYDDKVQLLEGDTEKVEGEVSTHDSFEAALEAVTANILSIGDEELYGKSQDGLEDYWCFQWDEDTSMTGNLYAFFDMLGIYSKQCRKWEEHHHGHVCVVERVRDKYLVPKIVALVNKHLIQGEGGYDKISLS